VPTQVTRITVVARGAHGAGSPLPYGGRVHAVIPVAPGEKLVIYVGGDASGSIGGFNGGANGAKGYCDNCPAYGGGGASDVRQGGGGPTDRDGYGAGGLAGKGGGRTGGAGGAGGSYCSGYSSGGGEGGTQSAGGKGGHGENCGYYPGNSGASGTLLTGGAGGQGGPYGGSGPGGGGGGGGSSATLSRAPRTCASGKVGKINPQRTSRTQLVVKRSRSRCERADDRFTFGLHARLTGTPGERLT
jgi:hypothetical protein